MEAGLLGAGVGLLSPLPQPLREEFWDSGTRYARAARRAGSTVTP